MELGGFLHALSFIHMTITTTEQQTKFALPQFNFNGTSVQSIEDEYHAALKAIRIAEQMLIQCTCHARDYQMQAPSEYLKARREREQVLAHCTAIHSYLEEWYWHAVDNN